MSDPTPEPGVPAWTVHTAPAPPAAPWEPYGPEAAVVPPVRRGPRVRPMVIAVAAVMAVLVGTVLVAVASVAENARVRTLLDRVEQSESVMVDFQTGLTELGTDPSRNEVVDLASTSRIELREARDQVAALRSLPWAPRIGSARDAYVEHADAWLGTMTSLAAGEAPGDSALINSTFLEACRLLFDAVPAIEGDDDRSRVETICADAMVGGVPTDGPRSLPV